MDDENRDFSVGNKKNPLRLLILDSLAKNAEDTIKMVRKLGYTVEAKQVKDTEELSQQVEKEHWDLMISPPRLGDSSSSQILTILARQDQDIPLLILATKMSDPLVLDALLSGARAVISKETPDFFGHTIKRELEDLAFRRALPYFEKLSQEYKEKCDFLAQQALNEPSELLSIPSASVVEPVVTPAPTVVEPVEKEAPAIPAEAESVSQVHKDILTDLLNHHYFIGELEPLLAKSADQEIQHALLYLDVDDFSTFRGKAGIAAGDLVLVEIAKILSNNLDVSCLTARYGDSSFAVLKKETDQATAQEIANSICKNIDKHAFAVVGKSIPRITCSIGISTSSGKATNIQEFISQAQSACKFSKTEGGNKASMFDEKMVTQATQGIDKRWEYLLRSALNDNRFRLVFQPIVNLHSKPTEKYETLLRMLDEDNNEILPGEFMSSAEQAGLMPELDRWVVAHALTELADRRRAGKDTTFFIKLSGLTLNDKAFPPWLGKQLNALKIPGDSIVFEISESIAIRHIVQVKKFMNWLKVMHCRSALDHFGTHPQSIDIMKELSADFLKIDRSFMHNLSDNKENMDKVKSIVGTAQSLNKQTIAQFVQDANCLRVLWQCGVDYIQGYFLQRPDETMMYDFSES